MNNVKLLLAGMAITMAACSPQKQAEEPTLKDVFKAGWRDEGGDGVHWQIS